MRMPPHELFRQRLHDVAEFERALLLRHAGMEHDLQQEITELFAQVIEVAARDGIGDLIGLLDRIRSDGREILLQIPWATGARRA